MRTSARRIEAEESPRILQTYECSLPVDSRLSYTAATFSKFPEDTAWKHLILTFYIASNRNLVLIGGYELEDPAYPTHFSLTKFTLETAPDELLVYPYETGIERESEDIEKPLTVRDYGDKVSTLFKSLELFLPKKADSVMVSERINSRLSPVSDLIKINYPKAG
jgi:hypothetical protein